MILNEVMKETADAIREKTGKSEKIAPINFAEEIKSISAGGGGSGESGEKAGMTYVSKEALFTALGSPVPETMSQTELRTALVNMIYVYPITGIKLTSGYISYFGWMIGEEIDESRFTYENWEAAALDWDAIKTTSSGNIPTWKSISQETGISTVEEFKGLIQQMFPNQLTEEDFFGK